MKLKLPEIHSEDVCLGNWVIALNKDPDPEVRGKRVSLRPGFLGG